MPVLAVGCNVVGCRNEDEKWGREREKGPTLTLSCDENKQNRGALQYQGGDSSDSLQVVSISSQAILGILLSAYLYPSP